MNARIEHTEQLELIPLKEACISGSLKGKELDDVLASKGSVLPKGNFIHRLRTEKLLADRSKAPLSMALFFLRENNGNGPKAVQEFLRYLNRITRETDIKGWLDQNVIGVLLPHTDKTGVNTYVEKVIQGNGYFNYSAITGTYPEHIFQQLLCEGENELDFFPLDLDENLKPFQFQGSMKRAIDVVGSMCGMILLSPLMLIIALAVKASSPGPVIFTQIRFGLKGVRFPFYKFRSMYWNTDDQIHREYVTNLIKGRLEEIDQGDGKTPFFKMKEDSRVTRAGRILRKLSLDELPQLFNVWKGEMSLVGPRPPIPYEIEKYEPWHLRRILEVKPGITGLWQVSGRSTTTFDEMVRLDLRYVKNWSLWLDLKILVKTLREVLHPRGAA